MQMFSYYSLCFFNIMFHNFKLPHSSTNKKGTKNIS